MSLRRQGHAFDLSKKGTLHLLLEACEVGIYPRGACCPDSALHVWGSGSRCWTNSLYPLIMDKDGATLDVGCGEGAHSAYLREKGALGSASIAFDISKEGVDLRRSQLRRRDISSWSRIWRSRHLRRRDSTRY
ncbi:MAG: class I SAM-dependent methyltransferase [Alkalibacterium sp.]|nr:class I SAM-dependent methyltransferase [Alkalibacterium sp.]